VSLDSNTYGSVAGVAAYTKHLTDDGAFTALTEPTLVEVEAFLDQTSDTLNGWLARAGYGIPVTQVDAVKVLARYANLGAAGLAELSMRGAGYNADDDNRRENKFLALFKEAENYISSGALALLGAAQTGSDAPGPLSGFRIGGTTRSGGALQPIFTRTGFGNDPTAENGLREEDGTR
jgi:hypothetical protein